MKSIPENVQALITRMLEDMQEKESILVAFSGGVDSSVVAALAHRALGDRSLAVTAASETLAARELEEAQQTASEIGIVHRIIAYSELRSENFASNPENRCYFCQDMRMGSLRALARQLGYNVVASGTNLSDTREIRPGLKAMEEHAIYQPLLKHGADKQTVRTIAQLLGLSVWDKPSMACLASRVPHGLRVTKGRLTMIERAESFLQQKGFRQFRVRCHDKLARIEIAPEEMGRAFDRDLWQEITCHFKSLGFEHVTLDLEGYRTRQLS